MNNTNLIRHRAYFNDKQIVQIFIKIGIGAVYLSCSQISLSNKPR